MERLLVVSPLDVIGSRNSRTRHLVRHLAPHFRETVAISKTNITHRSVREQWASLLRIRTEVRSEGTVRWVAMSPMGNVRHGLGLRLLGLPNPYKVPRWGIRRLLRYLLSSAGVVLELCILPSLVATYALRAGGRFDVVIAEGPWEGLLGLLLRALGRAGVVVYDDIDYAPGFQPISALRRSLTSAAERFAIRRADLVIAVGQRLAALRRRQGVRRVCVIPNGVDLERFGRIRLPRAGVGRRRPTLVYSGYLGAWAGTDVLLDAAARAAERVPGLRLILVGHGAPEDLAVLTARSREPGLAGVVEYRGEVDYEDLPDHLEEAELGLALFRPLDLTRYAFPLKVVEYMAAGLPVVTTEDTEAAEVVVSAGAGRVVPFEPEAVAGVLVELLGDRERLAHYSDNARVFAKGYDWKPLMRDAYDALRDCADGRLEGSGGGGR